MKITKIGLLGITTIGMIINLANAQEGFGVNEDVEPVVVSGVAGFDSENTNETLPSRAEGTGETGAPGAPAEGFGVNEDVEPVVVSGVAGTGHNDNQKIRTRNIIKWMIGLLQILVILGIIIAIPVGIIKTIKKKRKKKEESHTNQ